MKPWIKSLFILSLALCTVFSSLFVAGKLFTSRLETVDDPRALGSWGPGTLFLTTRSSEVHILDVGKGEVILLIHGSTGSIADWQEKIVSPAIPGRFTS